MRFTDPQKWKNKWFRSLSISEKILWFYLNDNCDNAGFFEKDLEMWGFFLGMNPSEIDVAFKGLARGLLGAKSGDMFHIRNFIDTQKNTPLNPHNNAHVQIIRILEKRKVSFESVHSLYLGANEGLNSPTGKGKGKGKGSSRVKYAPDFSEWWASYGVGSKQHAFDSWKKQNLSQADVEKLVHAVVPYKDYCASIDRSLKDGQGWLTGKFWETDWTHQAQGTKPDPKNAPVKKRRGLTV